jgi:16S rRNA processing protein RimM
VTGESFAGLTLARVLRPWGRRGEVAAEILTDFPKRLAAVREAWLYDGRKPPRPVRIVSCRIHLGQAILHFAGTESIDDAERLRGLEVQVPLAERAPIGAGRYYISELIGCTVWEQAAAADAPGDARAGVRDATANDAAGGDGDVQKTEVRGAGLESPSLGTVEDVRRIDAGDGASAVESWVLAVGTPEGELLIPLAAEICTRIDTHARRIEVRLPEGLRGLNAAS